MPAYTFSTSLGSCTVTWNTAGLTSFRLSESGPLAGGRPEAPEPAPPWALALADRVQRHLAGDLQDFSDLEYDFSGLPDFTRDVLRATLAVKAGRTATYGDIALALALPPAASRFSASRRAPGTG